VLAGCRHDRPAGPAAKGLLLRGVLGQQRSCSARRSRRRRDPGERLQGSGTGQPRPLPDFIHGRELREFIDRLREEFQVPYPLADRRPYVGSGRRLLIDLQDRGHLDPEFCLVGAADGQVVLTAPGEKFYQRVDWSGDEPAG
jgi:hypothetical protein